jgi:hypothetical protein
MQFRLGRSIAQIVPFYRHRQPEVKEQPKQHKEIITTNLVITMVIIAIVKIAVLILWI